MVWIENSLFCDGCGVEITWAPVVSQDHHYYCCIRCRDGEECDCIREQEGDDDRPGKPAAPTAYSD